MARRRKKKQGKPPNPEGRDLENHEVEPDTDSRIAKLCADVARLESKRKDNWDKLSIMTTFAASVLLVVIGGTYTAVYRSVEAKRQRDQFSLEQARIEEESLRLASVQRHEGRIKEMEVISSVLPLLDEAGDESQQVAAFRLIQFLASKEVAEQLTFLRPSRSALLFADQSAQEIINSRDATEAMVQEARLNFEKTVRRLLESQPYFSEASDQEEVERYYAGLVLESQARSDALPLLHNLLKTTHRPLSSYSAAKAEFLYPIIERHPDGSLRSIYSDQILTTEVPLGENSGALVFNTEQAVPQSWFNKEAPMRGDLHNMFACDARCNSYRGNYAYGVVEPDAQTRDDCGRRDSDYFEPMKGKGAVARATLYFLVRYPGVIGDSERELKPDGLAQLIAWHNAEPPGLYEKHRNSVIYTVQGNRNPFVDFPHWVNHVEFSNAFSKAPSE